MMDHTIKFNLTDIMPAREAVLHSQGIPNGATVQSKIHRLLDEAVNVFSTTTQPAGMISELSTKEFELIFNGAGENEEDALLEKIFPKADSLALFALTMGSEVSETIEQLFEDNDYALGSMLDAVASLAADKAAEECETYFYDTLSKRQFTTPDSYVLCYSPGYCGWHLSGQKKLFEYLQPEKIRISLNDSFLMSPLKSVTGVLVAGNKEIHIFETNYTFCSVCKTYSCRQRMKRMLTA